MKVAIAGATGVLGQALIPRLLKDKYDVVALVRTPQKAVDLFGKKVEAVECDLLAVEPDALAEMLKDCDAVAHLATAIPSDFSAPGAWDANTRLRTEGTRRLLDATLAAGVKRYIQQSIVMAYPDHGDAWITEDTPLDADPHRAGINGPVIEMEQMVRETSARKLRWCILRGGQFVGPGTFQERAIERLRGGHEFITADGEAFLPLIHVEDMAAAVEAALKHAPAGSTFNIVDTPIRQRDYLDQLAAAASAPMPRRIPDATPPLSLRCSNQAARDTLKWAPEHSLIPQLD